jgi:hypothetical protein
VVDVVVEQELVCNTLKHTHTYTNTHTHMQRHKLTSTSAQGDEPLEQVNKTNVKHWHMVA